MDRSKLLNAALADYGLSEQIIEAIYSRRISSGNTVVDGGAHTGLHTLPLATLVGTAGRVIAVEPVPETKAILHARVKHLSLSQVEIVEFALSDTPGPVEFTVVRNATTRSGIVEVPCPFETDVERVTVERILLDDLLEGISDLRFLKLDLEGGEYHALRGAMRSIQAHRPLLIFERSFQAPEWYGYTPCDFFDLFDSLGYRMCDLFGDPIIEAEWSRTRRPWYAIGVSNGSADDIFVKDELPAILDSFC